MKKLYFLLLTLISISAFAQTYDYTIYKDANSGIESNYIGDLKIDSNGLLWIASYSGASTFNVSTFTKYNTDNSGIASNSIVKIEIDGLGKKWMASQFNGIILFNGTTWTNYTTSNSGLPYNEIIDIAVDGLNNFGLPLLLDLQSSMVLLGQLISALNDLKSIATDSNNGVWVINDFNVLYKFNGADYDVVYQGVNKILKIENNTIYIDDFGGLMTFTTGEIFLTTYYQSNSCLSAYQVRALDVDSENPLELLMNGDAKKALEL